MSHTFTRRLPALAMLIAGLGAAGAADGAGFALSENSASGLGNAFAGGTAGVEDASAVWFNPAGMTRVQGSRVDAAVHVLVPSFRYTDRGSFQHAGAATLPLLPGSRLSDDSGTTAVVPNFYVVHGIGGQWKVGLGVTVPFGLTTEYENDWVGRFQAVKSEITTFNFNPSVAYQVTDDFSIGGGLDVMYMEAEFTNAVDFDAVCAALGPPRSATCTGLPGSGTSQGFARNTGNSVGVGANVGVLVRIASGTRIGAHYRSKVRQSLDGTADFTVPGGISVSPLVQAGIASTFADGGAGTDVDLPPTFSVGIHHDVNDHLAIMGDATWTGWDSIQELRFEFDNPATRDAVETLAWESAWRVSGGATFRFGNRWTVRGGGAFDQSPIPSAALRTARLPDADRTWVALGASYAISDRFTADFGYAHLYIANARINRTGSTGSQLVGSYSSDADIFSAQIGYRF